ncbi:MAG TPA: hypothetical protein DHV26_05405 [Cytophagales bacterium]|nr:hypothetical protein [Cytophagales bacterium]
MKCCAFISSLQTKDIMRESLIIPVSQEELRLLIKEVIVEAIDKALIRNENESTLINVQEAAALLNLAVTTLYEKTSRKQIPHYKHGKKVMFKKSELLAWVEACKVKTLKDIRKKALERLSS